MVLEKSLGQFLSPQQSAQSWESRPALPGRPHQAALCTRRRLFPAKMRTHLQQVASLLSPVLRSLFSTLSP